MKILVSGLDSKKLQNKKWCLLGSIYQKNITINFHINFHISTFLKLDVELFF